jgi:cytochrome c-type biogenesis protein CcmH
VRAGWPALALLCVAAQVWAVDNLPPLPNPQLEQRYLALTHELRCMQCQNESIADSPVGLAEDLRREVRDELLAGQTDEQIRDHMVARYGDFILFRPRMSWRNAWLWGAPILLMLVGIAVGVRVLRNRTQLGAGNTADSDSESPEP